MPPDNPPPGGARVPMASAEEFAVAGSPRLRRMAFLLCGDWHTAEDLVQSALAKVFVSWRKIRSGDAAHAYARASWSILTWPRSALRAWARFLPARFPSTRSSLPGLRSASARISPSPHVMASEAGPGTDVNGQ
jgi:hypothetical protein